MAILLTPMGLVAVCTILAGIGLFGCTSYLPPVFPPAAVRFVGFGAVCCSLLSLWVYSGSWRLPAEVGVCALVAMVVVHLVQTRQGKPTAAEQAPSGEDEPASPRDLSN